jgi:hypothetical protein
VQFDQRLGQGQAQAGALRRLGVLALDLFERPRQPLQVLGGDADAGVGDRHPQPVVVLP